MAEARAWWPASHAEVLDTASDLLGCTTPAELEAATCDLIGDHWQRMSLEHHAGMSPSDWLKGLLVAAGPRAGEPAVRRLLHGLATITAPGQARLALNLLNETEPTDTDSETPAWLDTPPAVSASPDVQLLRDVYGLRFGLLAQVTVADAPARSYLFDIDMCHGFERLVGCGYYPDTAAAVTAWRAAVGISAADAEPQPLPTDQLPPLLSGNVLDESFVTPSAGDGFRELYRADRIVHEIFDALERAGRPVVWPQDIQKRAIELTDDLTRRFREWAPAHDIDLPPATTPDDDVTRWVIGDWVTPGLTEDLALACSPHRVAAFVAYLNDDWVTDVRDQALTILEPWARYCLECSGVSGEAAEHTLAWAARAAREPEAVGGDLANDLSTAVDETTVIRHR